MNQTKAPEVSSNDKSSKTASLKTSDLVFTKTPLQALLNLVNRGRTKSNEDLDLKHYQILKRKKTDVSDSKMGDEEKYISGPHSLLRQPNTWDQVFHTREGEQESSVKTDSHKPFSTLNQIKFANNFPITAMKSNILIKPIPQAQSGEATPSL